MHPLWDIPELAQMIMYQCETRHQFLYTSKRDFDLALPIYLEDADADTLLHLTAAFNFNDDKTFSYTRLRKYCSAIRTLRLSFNGDYHYGLAGRLIDLHFESLQSPCQVIFHRLRDLKVDFYEEPEMIVLTRFLLPTLETLTFSGEIPSRNLMWDPLSASPLFALAHCIAQSQNITEFSDETCTTSHDLGERAITMFCGLRNVTTVRFRELPTSATILSSVLSMPHLKALYQTGPNIELPGEVDVQALPELPHLEILELQDFPSCTFAFALLPKTSKLQQVTIHTWDSVRDELEIVDTHRISSLITSSKESIARIDLECNPTKTFFLSDCSPLHDCSRLTHLSLLVNAETDDATDSDFRRMAASWPNLQYVSINLDPCFGPEMPEGPVLTATLDTLHHFSTFCPKLLSIALHGSAPRHTLRPTIFLNCDVLHRPLELDLSTIWCDLSEGGAESIARFLGLLFPGRAITLRDELSRIARYDAELRARLDNVQKCLNIQSAFYLDLIGIHEENQRV